MPRGDWIGFGSDDLRVGLLGHMASTRDAPRNSPGYVAGKGKVWDAGSMPMQSRMGPDGCCCMGCMGSPRRRAIRGGPDNAAQRTVLRMLYAHQNARPGRGWGGCRCGKGAGTNKSLACAYTEFPASRDPGALSCSQCVISRHDYTEPILDEHLRHAFYAQIPPTHCSGILLEA